MYNTRLIRGSLHHTDYIQPSRLFESFASRKTPKCKPLSGIVHSAKVSPAGYVAIVELIAEASLMTVTAFPLSLHFVLRR